MPDLHGGQLLTEIENDNPKLGIFLRTKVLPAINAIGQNASVAPVGNIEPPDPPSSVSVAVAGEYMHVAINHSAPIQKGIQYFTEVSTNPQFSQPLVIDHGSSRTSHPFPLPTNTSDGTPHTFYVRSYAQYHGSDPSVHAVVGGASNPTGFTMAGTTNMDLLPSQGSGTASNNGQQGGSGIGKVQLRPIAPPAKRSVK